MCCPAVPPVSQACGEFSECGRYCVCCVTSVCAAVSQSEASDVEQAVIRKINQLTQLGHCQEETGGSQGASGNLLFKTKINVHGQEIKFDTLSYSIELCEDLAFGEKTFTHFSAQILCDINIFGPHPDI